MEEQREERNEGNIGREEKRMGKEGKRNRRIEKMGKDGIGKKSIVCINNIIIVI